MIQPGQFNLLRVSALLADAVLLDGGRSGEVSLPLPATATRPQAGAELRVFIYLDGDGRFAATLETPLVELGQVAWLQVVDVNQTGAFVDWGLPKDLFIPFAEQQTALRKGQRTLVRVYLDNQNRVAGSTRIDHWISDSVDGLVAGDPVSLLIADRTDLGFKAIINHRSWGLLYGNELFRTLRKGQLVEGYVKRLREDGKVDLSLQQPGFSQDRLATVSQQILQQLDAHGGRLELSDKSPPEAIYARFGVSKKVFKQALGALYRQRRVTLEDGGINLVEQV